MQKPLAFLFDLNGTIIDDMNYHAEAWHHIMNNKLGTAISLEAVKAEMYGKNAEVLIRVFGSHKFTTAEISLLEIEKEQAYQKAYLPHLKPIKGFEVFVKKAAAQLIPMAIGSAAIPFNVDFVLDGLNIRKYFSAIVSAADVALSKPHPETFLKAAQHLQVPPGNCIVFEDAPKGVEAAANAGMPCVVITTMHNKEEFEQYDNILFFIEDYTDEKLHILLDTKFYMSDGDI